MVIMVREDFNSPWSNSNPRSQRLKALQKECFLRRSLTATAKADAEKRPVIAVLKRCATQNYARLRGRKGEAAIWPSKFFAQRPGTGVWQAGQSPCGVNLYFWIEYP